MRNFKGLECLQEVECHAGHLEADLKVLSLKLYTLSDDRVLAYLNTFSNECITYGEYSSCDISSGNSRNSKLRVLVTDLEEEERRGYGCKASVFRSGEEPSISTWSVVILRNSEYLCRL